MATYRKIIKDRAGNNIIPVVSDNTLITVLDSTNTYPILVRNILPNVYMITGSVTSGAQRTWSLPNLKNPLSTSQVYMAYGSGLTACKVYIDPNSSSMVMQSNNTGTFAISIIVYLEKTV